jgi:hypothetical protein
MGWNKPPATAWQLDRCDVCGDKMHRRKLVRTQVEFLQPAYQENFFSYSSYDGTYWVVDTAADAGSISFGNRADNARTTLTDFTTVGYTNCVQTWTGDGTMRAATATVAVGSTAILTFSAQVGPNERNTSPDMTVAVGITNNDGSVKQVIKTWTINTMTRVYCQEISSTLNDYGLGDDDNQHFFYIEVTNDGKWWIDELQLEAGTNSLDGGPVSSPSPAEWNALYAGKVGPGPFIRTSGALTTVTSDQPLLTSRKVCPDCLEPILSKSERFGRTDEAQVDLPVDVLNQEI